MFPITFRNHAEQESVCLVMSDNGLQTYNRKRDFRITPEPAGREGRSKERGLMFVVQKHDARRLHYDFRLEIDGVLVSWAVPKGPSYDPKDKRLAVRTEDHPLSYGDFEGIIPQKQYGAGPVMIWDKGIWMPLDKNPAKALQKGKLTFVLKGDKLRGEWTLARMNAASKGGKENWLLIKHTDDEIAPGYGETFLEETDYSVKTNRTFEAIASGEEDGTGLPLKELEKKYNAVQLATLVDSPPESDTWVHEVKYDGYRILVFVQGGTVRIRTRNGHDWTHRFPVLARAFDRLHESFVIDGEAVVLDENGLSDFKELQNGLENSEIKMRGYFFDLLYRNGRDFSRQPFSERRKALESLFKVLPKGPPLFLSETITGKADQIIGKACDLGLEGIISKNIKAAYSPGRSQTWLKSKCEKRQEFLICGFQPASDMPNAVGALHLGYNKGEALLYAGKVGTGFNNKTARDLYQKLKPLKTAKPAFSQNPGRHPGTIWVKPQVICEVKFGMWTQTGKVRHASYQGLRQDKPPVNITREVPEKITRILKKGKENEKKIVKGVTISNSGREIFPDAHITKGELAAFYGDMADLILPTLARRPVSIVRCPGGIDKECFFQRSKGKGMPEHIYSFNVVHNHKKHDYIYVDDVRGLVEIVQMGGIELHPWGSLFDDIDRPERIVFDLDPDPDIPFEAVKLAAQDTMNRLHNLGLKSFLKTTGGKGLHIIAPIAREHSWGTVKDFTRNITRQMVRDLPEVYTSNMAKKKRKGRIFVDYLRNDFASTSVMDYCVRARPGAAVAVPLDWSELGDLETASQFGMDDARARKKAGKKWLRAYQGTRQSLSKSMMEKAARR